MLRILCTIPHYHAATPRRTRSRHGSLRQQAATRIEALSACIRSLHELFGRRQFMLEPGKRVAHSANKQIESRLDIVVCTTRGAHLVDKIQLAEGWFSHHDTDVEPPMLGFECHRVLQERLGRYDFYCYLEDDLILHDPWQFLKLAWFTREVGNGSVLLPNRFEVGSNPYADKVYLDGDIPAFATVKYQDPSKSARVEADILGMRVVFRRALNPHSGCFFLNAKQMARWALAPHFLDRDVGFVGPLESAASLGVMRTFQVYKAASDHAAFLEIQHFGSAFLNIVRHRAAAGTQAPTT